MPRPKREADRRVGSLFMPSATAASGRVNAVQRILPGSDSGLREDEARRRLRDFFPAGPHPDAGLQAVKLHRVSISFLEAHTTPKPPPSTDPIYAAPRTIYPSRGAVHLQFVDTIGRLLAYRYRFPDQSLIDKLEASADVLPLRKPTPNATDSRGPFASRNYALWAQYRSEPFLSGHFLQDLPRSSDFIAANQPLFDHLSADLELIHPDTAQQFGFEDNSWLPLPSAALEAYMRAGATPPARATRLCNRFAGCAINQHMLPGVGGGCRFHRDTNDHPSGFGALVPFGTFTGGRVVLLELGVELEVLKGDILFFRGHLLTHGNTAIEGGSRHSLALYTHQSVLRWQTCHRNGWIDAATRKRNEEGEAYIKQLTKERSSRRDRRRRASIKAATGLEVGRL